MAKTDVRLAAAIVLAGSALAPLAGCPGPVGASGSSSTSAGGATSTGSAVGAGGAANGSCLPAEATAITAQCASCHAKPPVGGAPMSLVSYDDLAGASPKGGTYADRMVARMRDAASPMPPAGSTPPTTAQIDAFAAWVMSGMPKAACNGSTGSGAGGNPYNTPDQCTSMQTWPADLVQDFGNVPKSEMQPGRACIDCHDNPPNGGDTGPGLWLAGTVYPTAHEPDECFGVDGSATSYTVTVTDAMGQSIAMKVGQTGDFHLRKGTAAPVVFPIHAKVTNDKTGAERTMGSAVPSGDCNSCHTIHGSGSPMAPGRIMAP